MISRRRLLSLAIGAFAVGDRRAWRALPTWHGQALAFGTQVAVTVAHQDVLTAQRAIRAALEAALEVDRSLSLYRPDSALRRLNAAGQLRDPDPLLLEVLAHARRVSQWTQGAFDVTVQPLWALGDVPENPAALERVRTSVGWPKLHLSRNEVRFLVPGMAVTLNGIAQGFAGDRMRAALEKYGIRHALIDSGELGTLGKNTTGQDWVIGLRHPLETEALLGRLRLSGRFASTSAVGASSLGPAHHIFDPQCGRAALEVQSVTVLAATGWLADALSTALFVLGAERGFHVLARFSGIEALILDHAGRIHTTPGFVWQPHS